MNHRLLITSLFAVVVIAQPLALFAQDRHFWDGGGATNFLVDPQNWESDSAPGSGDDAVFNVDALVLLAANTTLRDFEVARFTDPDEANVNLQLGGSTLNLSEDLTVGGQSFAFVSDFFHTGTLVTNNGTINVGGAMRIGHGGSLGGARGVGTGTLQVNGTTINVSDGLFLGGTDSSFDPRGGYLRILNGGVVNSDRAEIDFAHSETAVLVESGTSWNNDTTLEVQDGTIVVQSGGELNSGSIVLDAPAFSTLIGGSLAINGGTVTTGSLDISGDASVFADDGGELNVAGISQISTQFGRSGRVSITDSATFTSGQILVGDRTNGNLDIESGGTVSVDEFVSLGHLDSISSGSLSVLGSTSNLSVGTDLIVGREGTGTVTVGDGGTVDVAGDLRVGQSVDSSGTVSVSGVNSHIDVGDDIIVGIRDNGQLAISNGATVLAGDQIQLGSLIDSDGTASVSGVGSTLSAAAVLKVGNSGHGALDISSGGLVTSARGEIGENADGVGTVNVSGAGSRWELNRSGTAQATNGNMVVGAFGNGTLNITNGGVVSNFIGAIATQGNSTGTVTVNGAGSEWNNSESLVVGWTKSGVLNIEDGAVVTSDDGVAGLTAGSVGVVNVDGGGSQWNISNGLSVGRVGTGVLNISDGGSVSSEGYSIGEAIGSDGQVTVTGAGSQLNASRLSMIGEFGGSGVLNILDGGVVNNLTGDVEIGAGTGTAMVSGNGSVWNSSFMVISNTGTADVEVENGGVINSHFALLGQNEGVGTVSIRDTGSRWNIEELWFGSGTGNVNVESGAFMETSDAYLGSGFANLGSANVTVTGANSLWRNTFTIDVGASQFGTVAGAASLAIESGGTVETKDLLVRGDGFVNFSGGKLDIETLDLSAPAAHENFNMTGGRLVVDTVIGDLEINGGVLAPGDSPGLTDIQGNLDLLAGGIEFEIGGLSRGIRFDAIDVDGLATLDGVMDVNFINGYSAMLGDSFLIVDATGGIVGDYSFDFSDAQLISGLAWDTSQFGSDGFISVVAFVPEPGATTLLVMTMCVLSVRRRRELQA